MAGGDRRNIFRAVAIDHDQGGMMYDYRVEVVSLVDEPGAPLADWEIRQQIEGWLEENDVLAALSHDRIIWFAHETDATLFYLRFT